MIRWSLCVALLALVGVPLGCRPAESGRRPEMMKIITVEEHFVNAAIADATRDEVEKIAPGHARAFVADFGTRQTMQPGQLTDIGAGRIASMDANGMFNLPQLQFALQAVGADRIMYSADYPYYPNEGARAFLENAPISQADKEKIAHGNAERLFKLK